MGTLVHDPFFEEVPGFFGISLEKLLEAKHPTAWLEFERGKLSPDEYYATMFADGRPVDGTALERHVRAAYRFEPGMEELLGELSSTGRDMHALSNYPVWYRMIEAKLGLSRYLSWNFLSCHTGLRKPEPAAYTSAAESLGVAPGDCLFIDDRQANCDGARAVGMPAVRFVGAQALREELRRSGAL